MLRESVTLDTRIYRMHPLTEWIIEYLLNVSGVQHITAKNVGELYERAQILAMVRGREAMPPRHDADGGGWTESEVTYQELVDHVGTWTNWTPKTRAAFKKQEWTRLEQGVQFWRKRAENSAG